MRAFINSCLLMLSLGLAACCLWVASHLAWYWAIVAIWAFALINNLPFAMMHEAVHGVAAKSSLINRMIGVISSWAFPTSFLLQQQAHLGHHARNRTDADLYDYYLPHQSTFRRNVMLIGGNLLGLYYVCVVLSNIIYLMASGFYKSTFFKQKIATPLGFNAYIEDVSKLPTLAVWSEIALAFGYQIFLFWWLDLTLWGYLLCVYAFAVHWSVLQYADHAWSSRDITNGAWNLKVLPVSRWLALNYHYHLAHHQYPTVPWYELPKLVDKVQLQPTFWRVYFSLWRGVRPAPPMGAPADLAFLFPEYKEAKQ